MSTDGEQLLGNPELVEDVLDGIDAYLRSVPSFRRAHARGESFRGYFTATPQAAGLSTAEHLQGDRIETVSNGSPCPYDPDHSSPKKGSPIGIGVRFELPSGAIAALAALSVPAFPPRDAHDFLALSAFFAVDARGQRRAFRYRLVPRAGIVALDPAAHRRLPPQYLLSEMKTRLQDEPAEWDLVFQMAEPGDPTDDMTKQWPEKRAQITVGRLVVDRVHEDQEAAGRLVYDPTNVPPGIEPSADPVLQFRSHIYAGSFNRRTSEDKPRIVPE